jgi:hypothetical protein
MPSAGRVDCIAPGGVWYGISCISTPLKAVEPLDGAGFFGGAVFSRDNAAPTNEVDLNQ